MACKDNKKLSPAGTRQFAGARRPAEARRLPGLPRVVARFLSRRTLLCAVFAPLFFSCASVPKPDDFYQGRSGFALMEEGAVLYMTAEVEAVRPVLDALVLGGMSGEQLKQFLDMSDTLTAAIFQVPGKRHFYAAASGDFPSASGIFFGASKDWEKKVSASGMPYWYSSYSQLGVSVSMKNAYISDDDPFVPPPGAQIPAALPELQKGSALSGWMDDPAASINRLIAAFEVPVTMPVERLLFSVYPVRAVEGVAEKGTPENQLYYAVLRFETPSASQAAGLTAVFTMARMGMALADFSEHKNLETLARAFFSRNPQQDGSALVLTTGHMNGKDIALLFNSISVY